MGLAGDEQVEVQRDVPRASAWIGEVRFKGPQLGAQKTTQTQGSRILVPRPNMRRIPETMFGKILDYVYVVFWGPINSYQYSGSILLATWP